MKGTHRITLIRWRWRGLLGAGTPFEVEVLKVLINSSWQPTFFETNRIKFIENCTKLEMWPPFSAAAHVNFFPAKIRGKFDGS